MSVYDTGIRPVIDEYLDSKAKEQSYPNHWRASSAGYCMRKNIFERLGVPPVKEDARKTRVFESGHVFHEWVQRITKNAGLSIAQELELSDEELDLVGHFDDLILLDDNLILYDYKTAHSRWFEYAKNRPMSHYNRMQLGTYMYMLRKDFNGKDENYSLQLRKNVKVLELTEARIMKISKDDLRLHEIVLMWSPELEKEVYQYWSTLNGYWKNKKMPRCTCAEYDRDWETQSHATSSHLSRFS